MKLLILLLALFCNSIALGENNTQIASFLGLPNHQPQHISVLKAKFESHLNNQNIRQVEIPLERHDKICILSDNKPAYEGVFKQNYLDLLRDKHKIHEDQIQLYTVSLQCRKLQTCVTKQSRFYERSPSSMRLPLFSTLKVCKCIINSSRIKTKCNNHFKELALSSPELIKSFSRSDLLESINDFNKICLEHYCTTDNQRTQKRSAQKHMQTRGTTTG